MGQGWGPFSSRSVLGHVLVCYFILGMQPLAERRDPGGMGDEPEVHTDECFTVCSPAFMFVCLVFMTGTPALFI